jgi:hypothetical protein
MNSPERYRPLPDPLQEDEVEIQLTWKANGCTRVALERQAKLNQFDSVTEYLLGIVIDRLLDDEADTVQRMDGNFFCSWYAFMTTTAARAKV